MSYIDVGDDMVSRARKCFAAEDVTEPACDASPRAIAGCVSGLSDRNGYDGCRVDFASARQFHFRHVNVVDRAHEAFVRFVVAGDFLSNRPSGRNIHGFSRIDVLT
jgi:hypothetical protein